LVISKFVELKIPVPNPALEIVITLALAQLSFAGCAKQTSHNKSCEMKIKNKIANVFLTDGLFFAL
jgi:hypothetical protein